MCMDQIVVDLGDNEYGVQQGDEAIIFGVGGMSATALADAAEILEIDLDDPIAVAELVVLGVAGAGASSF